MKRVPSFRTFHCFEANSHFEQMLRFGTCRAFITFLRFETIIFVDFLTFFANILDISRNPNISKYFQFRFLCFTQSFIF